MLTQEQKDRIERNRLAALARRAELAKQRGQVPNQSINNQSTVTSSVTNLNSNRISTATNPISNNLATNTNSANNRVQAVTSSKNNQQNSTPNQPATGLKYNFKTAINQSANSSSFGTTNQSTVNSSSNSTNQSANSSTFRTTNQLTVNSSSNSTNQHLNVNSNKQPINRPNNQANATVTSNQSNGFNNNKSDYFIKPNQNSNLNRVGSSSNMTQIMNHNKFQNQNQNNFITPAKRPAEQSSFDKRLKSDNPQVKSPYEQVMDKSIPTFKIEFKLLDNREFYLDFRYNNKLIEAIRKIKSPRYDPTNKRWIFRLQDYKEVLESVRKLRIERVKIELGEGFPDDLLKLLEDSLKYNKVKVLLEEKLKSEFIGQLFPYQKEGVRFAIKREGRVLLADDMGLGKTLQALAIAVYYSNDWPLLIVTPASVKFQWKDAILRWIPHIKSSDIREIDSRKKNESADCSNLIVITSYDSVHKVENYIREPKCVILDECHMIKDSKTQRYKLIQKLVHKAMRLVLISGTPAMSRPIELFTQLKLLMPKNFSNKEKYINRYCDPKVTNFRRIANGCTKGDELKVVLESTVMIRRLKNDVLSELPPKRRVKVNLDCHLVGKDKSDLEKFMSRFRSNSTNTNDESFLQAYSKTAEVKLESICNYLEIVLEKGTKFIIFAHHRTLVEGISEFLQKKQKSFIKIDGQTSINERNESIKHFQNESSCVAAVLSLLAAGVGLTLTAAELVLFAELYFNPGTLIQAEDRVHRIGQKNSVLIEYLIAPGTVDDHIWSMIHRKIETLDQLGLKSNDNFVIAKNDSK